MGCVELARSDGLPLPLPMTYRVRDLMSFYNEAARPLSR
jgi:hypothetical protein